MRKFFVKTENINENEIMITGTDVNHIKNVLRLAVGEKIQICNQENSQNYICEITSISNESVITRVLEEVNQTVEGNIELHIFQGLPKADKMELIIQKGTELGVCRFIPVAFKRSIVKLTGKDEEKKISRWQKIAEVAAKQSHRDIVPEISSVVKTSGVYTINVTKDMISDYDIVIVAYENEKENTLKKELQDIKTQNQTFKIAVVIGPEGGIEETEVEQLRHAGAKIVSLGKRILRTETVALSVASIIMYELEM